MKSASDPSLCRSRLKFLDSSGLSIRDQYILGYAEYLHSDPALWQVTVDYMYSCGAIGKLRADESSFLSDFFLPFPCWLSAVIVLIRVPLCLSKGETPPDGEQLAVDKIRAGDVVGVLQKVNKACFEYGRESVRRTVCRVGFNRFVYVPQLSRDYLTDCGADACRRKGLRSRRILLCFGGRLARTWICCRPSSRSVYN